MSALLAALGAAGCAGGPIEAIKTDAPYAGPPMAIESTGAQHRIIMTAPTSGWRVTLDGTTPRLNHTDIFITIVRPNPAFMQTQALVNQEVGSTVETDRAIEAYARVLEFGEKPADQPYQRAGAAPPPPQPAP